MTATELQAPEGPATPVIPPASVSSNGGPPEADEPTLQDLVREALDNASDPNPHSVVEALLEDLTDGQLKKAARRGLAEIASDIVRKERARGPRSEARPSSSKWDDVAKAEQEDKDTFMFKICTAVGGSGEVWKYLGECNKADLAGAESILAKQVAGKLRTVKALQVLRTALKTDGAKVKSLGRERVRGIWNA